MIDLIAGWLLVLAGGLIGAESLIERQPSLKGSLKSLHAYQDSLGIFNLGLGIGGTFHAISVASLHIYAPLYWVLYCGANITAILVGLTLAIGFLNEYLLRGPKLFHTVCMQVTMWCELHKERLSWIALVLGLWRALDALIGS